MKYKVVFTPQARQDLNSIYDYITENSYRSRAIEYIMRIESFCSRLARFPARGRQRDDLRAGLRCIGFEKRVTVAFHIEGKTVFIERVLYAGRCLKKELDDE